MQQVRQRKAEWDKIAKNSGSTKGTSSQPETVGAEFDEDATESEDFDSACDSNE